MIAHENTVGVDGSYAVPLKVTFRNADVVGNG